jgi:hypothetical protein
MKLTFLINTKIYHNTKKEIIVMYMYYFSIPYTVQKEEVIILFSKKDSRPLTE